MPDPPPVGAGRVKAPNVASVAPAVDAASTQPGPSAGDDPDPLAADEAAAEDVQDGALEIAR
jgi:hypothetical protein